MPALATYHPSFLLRTPARKAEAWTDLLSLQARLEGKG
jgi:DNA polymerase